jgi:Asp-tRNA(Asn)/Glu-tRNA(Gln) amidotransferase A subunit family amidase
VPPGYRPRVQTTGAAGALSPSELSATQAAAAIAAGELDSTTLVQACLDRIAERDGVVGAWQLLDPERALRSARESDATAPIGPLHGVPVGIKDLIDTADLPTRYGSDIYTGHRPATDAACVARLRAAGAVVLGKTVTTEFAAFSPGRTANPLDPTRTPGGSSSGSSAAVADRMVPIALGTQTAASIVRPASFCGVFGMKPTFGRVDRSGVKPLGPSLDTVGWFARTPDDLALVGWVLGGAGGAAKRAAPLPEHPRIGFVRTPQWPQADASTQERLLQAVQRLATDADIREISLPGPFDGLVEAQTVVMEREAALALDGEWRDHRDELSDQLQEMLARGRALPEAVYEQAQQLASDCRGRLDDLFADVDFLLAPSAVGEAPPGLERTGDPVFARMWTLLGVPSVSVPGLVGPAGMPLGVQVLTPSGTDERAVDAAAWLAARLR